MNYILYDGRSRDALLPFTFTRPVADLRIGIFTIREKWEKYLRLTTTTLTEEYLSHKYPLVEMEQNIFINASYLPNPDFFKAVKYLKPNHKIICDGDVLAFYSREDQEEIALEHYDVIELKNISSIQNKWDLCLKNKCAMRQDFEWIKENDISEEIPQGVQVVNKSQIFIEQGATIFPCVLNASEGPIYIGKNATVLDGALIRGPFALGENSVVKMGAKIYGSTSIGPNCKVGGELKNSIFFANSNKGHEGYIGDSVIGEWCNLGAGTSVSNLKNTLSNIKMWTYEDHLYEDSQQLYCGLMLGDYSRTGVNSTLNSGTVVGVSVNIFGEGFMKKFMPSFTWGRKEKNQIYKLKKALSTATRSMELSNQEITKEELHILEEIFYQTKKYRDYVEKEKT